MQRLDHCYFCSLSEFLFGLLLFTFLDAGVLFLSIWCCLAGFVAPRVCLVVQGAFSLILVVFIVLGSLFPWSFVFFSDKHVVCANLVTCLF